MRKRVMDLLDCPDTDPSSLEGEFTFATGNSMGKKLTEVFMQAGIWITDDTRNDAYATFRVDGLELPFSGRIDIIVDDPFYDTFITTATDDAESDVPVELKTIKESGFNSFEGYSGKVFWGASEVPKVDHVMQLHHYMYYLRKPYGYLVYFNKNDQKIAIHWIPWSDAIWADILGQARSAEAWRTKGELPPKHSEGYIEFYKRGGETERVTIDHESLQPKVVKERYDRGDISKRKFPCAWEGGSCSKLSVCWFREIVDNGNDALIKATEDRLLKAGYDPATVYKVGILSGKRKDHATN